MGTTRKFKYAYVVAQRGPVRIELFGTDTKLTDAQLELKRRELNTQGRNAYHISELALAENDGHRLIIRSSKHSGPVYVDQPHTRIRSNTPNDY